MTLLNTSGYVAYAGNGVTAAFPIPFPFQNDGDVTATVTAADGTVTIPSRKTVGAGNPNGGMLTFLTAPAAGTTVFIYRDPPITQDASYVDHSKFPAVSHERAIDKGRMIEQRTRDIVLMAVHASDADAVVDMSLPTIPNRAGRIFAFNADGTPSAVDLAYSIPGTPPLDFASVATVQNAVISGSVLYVRTGGFYAGGDGGGALYKRVASQPSHSLKIQSSDGAWWEIAEPNINVLMAGAVRDGSADASGAFAAALTKASELKVPAGVYSLSAPILVGSNQALIGAGRGATTFQRFPGSSPAYLVGTVVPPDLSTPTVRVILKGFTIQGDGTLDNALVCYGTQFSILDDILVRDCTKSGAWGISLFSKGFAGSSTTIMVYCNKNRIEQVFTDNCYNGLRVQKGADDPTSSNNTAGNITRIIGGGDKDYQGTGLGLYSSQGSTIVGRFNQTVNDHTIGFEISGQYTTLVGCTADTNLAMTGAPGFGTIPGTTNAYGFQNGRVNSSIGVLFARYNDARGGAATGSVMIAQQGDGCYDRITFTDNTVWGSVTVLNNTAGMTLSNPRAINLQTWENTPSQRVAFLPTSSGGKMTYDYDGGQASGTVAFGYGTPATDPTQPPGFVEKMRNSWDRTTGLWSHSVGSTSPSIVMVGASLQSDGHIIGTVDSGVPLALNRLTSDGDIASFYKDTSKQGSISISSTAVAYNTSSDRRLKDNPEPLGNAVDLGAMFDALAPYRFTWRVNGEHGYGMFADELQTVIPDAVTGTANAVDAEGEPIFQSVDYSRLVPFLVAEVKALRARVAALEEAKAGPPAAQVV